MSVLPCVIPYTYLHAEMEPRIAFLFNKKHCSWHKYRFSQLTSIRFQIEPNAYRLLQYHKSFETQDFSASLCQSSVLGCCGYSPLRNSVANGCFLFYPVSTQHRWSSIHHIRLRTLEIRKQLESVENESLNYTSTNHNYDIPQSGAAQKSTNTDVGNRNQMKKATTGLSCLANDSEEKNCSKKSKSNLSRHLNKTKRNSGGRDRFDPFSEYSTCDALLTEMEVASKGMIKDPMVWSGYCRQILKMLPYFEPVEIASLLTIFSHIGYRDTLICQALFEALYWKIMLRKATPRTLAAIMEASTELKYCPNERHLNQILRTLTSGSFVPSPPESVYIQRLITLAKADIKDKLEKTIIGRRFLENASSTRNNQSSNYQKAELSQEFQDCETYRRETPTHTLPSVLLFPTSTFMGWEKNHDDLLTRIKRTVGRLEAPTAILAAEILALEGYLTENVLRNCINAVIRNERNLNIDLISKLMKILRNVKHVPSNFFELSRRQVDRQSSRLPPPYLVQLLRLLAETEHRDQELLRDLAILVDRQLSHFTPMQISSVLLSFKALQFAPICVLNSLSYRLVTPATLRAIDSPFTKPLQSLSIFAVEKKLAEKEAKKPVTLLESTGATPRSLKDKSVKVKGREGNLEAIKHAMKSKNVGGSPLEVDLNSCERERHGAICQKNGISLRVLGKSIMPSSKPCALSHHSTHPLSVNPQLPVFRFETGPNQTVTMGRDATIQTINIAPSGVSAESNNLQSLPVNYSALTTSSTIPSSFSTHQSLPEVVFWEGLDASVSTSLLLLLSSLPPHIRAPYKQAMQITAANMALHLSPSRTGMRGDLSTSLNVSVGLPYKMTWGTTSVDMQSVATLNIKRTDISTLTSLQVSEKSSAELCQRKIEKQKKKNKKIVSIFDVVRSVQQSKNDEVATGLEVSGNQRQQANKCKVSSEINSMNKGFHSNTVSKDTKFAYSRDRVGSDESLRINNFNRENQAFLENWTSLDPFNSHSKTLEYTTEIPQILLARPKKRVVKDKQIIPELPISKPGVSGVKVTPIPSRFTKPLGNSLQAATRGNQDPASSLPFSSTNSSKSLFKLAGGAIPLSCYERTAAGIGNVKSFMPAFSRIEQSLTKPEKRLYELRKLFGPRGHPATRRLVRRYARNGIELPTFEKMKHPKLPSTLTQIPKQLRCGWQKKLHRLTPSNRKAYVNRTSKQQWKSFSSHARYTRTILQARKIFLQQYRELTEYWETFPRASTPEDLPEGCSGGSEQRPLGCHSKLHSQQAESQHISSERTQGRPIWQFQRGFPFALEVPFQNTPPPILLAIDFMKRQIAQQSFTPTSVELRLSKHLRLLWGLWERANPKTEVWFASVDVLPTFLKHNSSFHCDILPLVLPPFDHLPNRAIRCFVISAIRQAKYTAEFFGSRVSNASRLRGRTTDIKNNTSEKQSNEKFEEPRGDYNSTSSTNQSLKYDDQLLPQTHAISTHRVIKLNVVGMTTTIRPSTTSNSQSDYFSIPTYSVSTIDFSAQTDTTESSLYRMKLYDNNSFGMPDIPHLYNAIQDLSLPDECRSILQQSLTDSAIQLSKRQGYHMTFHAASKIESNNYDTNFANGLTFTLLQTWSSLNAVNNYVCSLLKICQTSISTEVCKQLKTIYSSSLVLDFLNHTIILLSKPKSYIPWIDSLIYGYTQFCCLLPLDTNDQLLTEEEKLMKSMTTCLLSQHFPIDQLSTNTLTRLSYSLTPCSTKDFGWVQLKLLILNEIVTRLEGASKSHSNKVSFWRLNDSNPKKSLYYPPHDSSPYWGFASPAFSFNELSTLISASISVINELEQLQETFPERQLNLSKQQHLIRKKEKIFSMAKALQIPVSKTDCFTIVN